MGATGTLVAVDFAVNLTQFHIFVTNEGYTYVIILWIMLWIYTPFVDLKAILGYKDKCRLGTKIELSKARFVCIFEDQIYLGRIKRML